MLERARSNYIGKNKCVPHGGLRWRRVGRVDAAWVPHGDRSQRVKRVNAPTQRDVRGNALNGGRGGRTRKRIYQGREQ
jgi:hypothetical protein